jgi:hypothetical protein
VATGCGKSDMVVSVLRAEVSVVWASFVDVVEDMLVCGGGVHYWWLCD